MRGVAVLRGNNWLVGKQFETVEKIQIHQALMLLI